MHRHLSRIIRPCVPLLALALGSVAMSGPVASAPNLAAPSTAGLPDTTCGLVATTRSCEIWAKTGTLALPGATNVAIWGFSDSAAAVARTPGPPLIVNQGETVQITLHNQLTQSVALALPGQPVKPDTTGAPAGGTQTYSFVAGQPGTYLYEAGLTANGPRQVAMGLFGALLVRPSGCSGCAYNPSSAFDDEALVALSEIDPALNAAPTTFEMRNYAPRYWLINGKAFPATDPIVSASGRKVLLRYVNAGLAHHSMGLLGLSQRVVAADGQPLTNQLEVVAQTIPTGGSLDTIAAISGSAPPASQFAMYDAAMHLDNNGALVGSQIAFGGMLTFLTTPAGPPGADTQGPLTSNVAATPNPTTGSVSVTLSATVSDVTTGNHDVARAEYFVDTVGPSNSGAVMAGPFGSPTVNVSATLTSAQLATLAGGNHTLYVHGQDSLGNWGAVASTILNLDKVGPTTSNVTLSPAAANGSANVTVQATASDAASGGHAVDAAEYFVDAACVNGTGSVITIDLPAATVSLNVVLAAATVNALSEGAHAIGVHARDSLGNWGACAVATLIVDKTGPNTTGVVARPNPNNGTLGVLVGDFLMERIDGTSSDPVAGGVNSNIAAIEGFVDTVGADGSGLVAVATDAHFDSPSEAGYITLPLYTVTAMNEGPHSVYMHGKDAAGNWGPVSSTTLVVDKTGPNVSGLSVTPNPSAGAASVTLSASATDPVVTGTSNASNVVAAEYIFGPDQGAGTGTAIPVSTPASTVGLNATVSLAGVPSGSYLISVRAKDAAGNWGPVATRLLQVLPADGLFADSFEAGNLLAWSATAGANLGVTSAAAMNTGSPAGSRGVYGLRAGISSGVSGYVQDNRASPESSYRARFYFNPNGTTSAGHDILVAVNGSTTVFRVQYRTNLGQAQVRAVVTRALGTTATNWFAIGAAGPNAIEVAWQSGTSASFSLYTGGALRQTLTALNTSALTLRVAAARLGPQNVGSAVSGTEYFDEFVSTRSTPIGP